MRIRFAPALLLLAAPGCGTPNVTSLTPSTGPERSLVEVKGDVFLSAVVWDAGKPEEAILPGGLFSAYMFSVPPGAALGSHHVQLTRTGERGTGADFVVTAAPFGAPRVDRVSVVGTTFEGDSVQTWLYVQGANADVGAEVLVDDQVVPTVSHQGLRNDLFGVDPTTLDYPIYHYVAMVAAPGKRPAGATVTVRIRNLDKKLSPGVPYVLPADSATLDSDGDDIPDQWEVAGYDADGDGDVDVDLPALGAHPHRPDVLLEVDVMEELDNPPTPETFAVARAAFAAAPVLSPLAEPGVNLVTDVGTVPFRPFIEFNEFSFPQQISDFYGLKQAHFDNAARGRLFHYCIWGNERYDGASGRSDFDAGKPGDDCMVTFDDAPLTFHTPRNGAETLLHELGHNLLQLHGGSNNARYNPVYSSVMSYSWQMRTGFTMDSHRVAHPVCLPFYYADPAAAEVKGKVSAMVGTVVDYSEGMGRTLDEAALDETTGVCDGVAVDWNKNGVTTDKGVVANIDDLPATGKPADFANWPALRFTGPRMNGKWEKP